MRRLYVLFCLLYAGVNAIVMTVAGAPAEFVLWFAMASSLPPALLGILVVRWFRPRSWLHSVAAGLAFAFASVSLTTLLLWLIEPSRFVFRIESAVWGLLIAALVFVIIASGAQIYRVQANLVLERERAAAAEASRARAELEALRSRVDPHFLFNTLHSLLALVRQDPGRAEQAIEQFADILRYTFAASDGGEERTLAQEWQLVDNYLALEKLRLGARLRVDEQLDAAAADAPMPVLTLQPLVENAVRHAIAPRAAGGRIELRAARSERGVRIEVSDDGPGADPQEIASARGHGLHLVRERLDRMYRGRATMELSRSAEGGFRVTIELPPDYLGTRSDT